MMFSCISLLKDNQSTWVMIHSIIRERSWVDCFSLRPYIYIVHSLLYIYAWLSVYFSCSNCMRRCALFTRYMLVHSLYMCISHATLFFLINQLSIVVRVVLVDQQRWEQLSSSSSSITRVTHLNNLFSLVLFVCRWPNNTRYMYMCSLFSISNSWPLWAISFFFFLVAHSYVKIWLMNILICKNICESQ
jgi:hypothetical protein